MKDWKRYPKMAYVSLGLLLVALALFWGNWVTLKQPSAVSLLMQVLPGLEDGGISFADGRAMVSELEKVSSSLTMFVQGDAKQAMTMIQALNIAIQVLFFGTIAAVVYCAYARITWKTGLSEGIYFLMFLGDALVMYLLMNQLNQLCGEGTFGISFWGLAAIGCALLSEILWEEASFGTAKPAAADQAANSEVV